MATVGHVAVALAAARVHQNGRLPRWPLAAVWAGLSMLPDVDVLGFSLGVRYADPWGHRGATHSLTVALALGLIVGVAARCFKRPATRAALFAGTVLASHGLLDTMTDGGLGCALLWPFDLTRYFAPWRPIPVAPIGLGMISLDGAMVLLIEGVLLAPLLLYALGWPMRTRPIVTGALGAVWLLAVWLLSSSDPIREAIVRGSTLFE